MVNAIAFGAGLSKQLELNTGGVWMRIVHAAIIRNLTRILLRLDDLERSSYRAVRRRRKAVSGASRNEIVETIGDRLKVRISAAPEAGKANTAICKLIASAIGVKVKQVSIDSGQTSPEKIVRISGAVLADVVRELR